LSTYATSTEVTSGVANMGDTVIIDFVGTLDGVAFEGGTATGCELTLGSGQMIDGFEDQIAGHSVGEVFDIFVTFPENYGSADLAGQDAVFTITITSKIDKVYPEYTDEFVATNTGYATIAAYEEYLMNALQEDATQSDEDSNKSKVMTAAVDAATINEYPEQDMKEMIDDTINQVESEAISNGYELIDYLTAYYGYESVEDFKADVEALVESYMKEKIVVCAIAKAEKISVSKDEIEDYKKNMMESLAITDEEVFAGYYSDEDVAYYALAEKVVEHLLEVAKQVPATATDAAQ